MSRVFNYAVAVVLFASTLGNSQAQEEKILRTLDDLDLKNVSAQFVEYQGLDALNVTGNRQADSSDAERQPSAALRQPVESLAIVKNVIFKNGTIEVELAGRPSDAAGGSARGFIGVAFHLQKADPIAYDCFYLRPTNGRADDQLRRNHACQYIAHPEHTWNQLRENSPGVYESYVDLEVGQWIKVKIEVDGQKARLFVNGADQPCLIVNDLKRAQKAGPIALWLEQSTDAYYRNLVVTDRDKP